MPNMLRAAALVALVVVLSVVWVVHLTVQPAQDSSQGVVHTQEVLATVEGVLSTAVDAESAVHDYLTSADDRALEPFDRAGRSIDADVDRLAALTVDNPTQQTRVRQLRQDVTLTLAALRAQADAKRDARPSSPEHVDAQRVSMDAARATMRAIRSDENRLLADRVEAGRSAVSRLQETAIAPGIVAVGALAWIIWLLARNARRQRQGTDLLRRTNEDLESQVGASAADLRGLNARLRSIIDSAVDGIIVIDAKGQIDAFNRGAERLFGYSEDR